MNRILRAVKIIVSLGIFTCMFVPLAKCTYHPEKNHIQQERFVDQSGPEQAESTSESVLIIAESLKNYNLVDYWLPMMFVLPLFFCIPFGKSLWKFWVFQSLQTIYAGLFLYLIAVLVYGYYSPLLGGYILTLFTVMFFTLSCVEWYVFWRSFRS